MSAELAQLISGMGILIVVIGALLLIAKGGGKGG